MSSENHNPALHIKKIRGMGRGVFAGRAYRTGEVIEVCPVIPLPPGTEETVHGGALEHYLFKWGRDWDTLAVALGYGSLYNHSADPNAAFTPRMSKNDIVFRAIRDIAADEQITIDYQWDESEYASFR